MRKLEQLKHLQAIQSKITFTMQSPSRFSHEAAESEIQDASFFTLLRYYFDRIPALKQFRPYQHFGSYSSEDVKQLLKHIQEFKQVQQELKDWTFLPYTEHKSQVTIPKEMRCSFESINLERTRQFEASIKKEFVKLKVDQLQAMHEKSLREHMKRVRDFVKDNPSAVDEERTRYSRVTQDSCCSARRRCSRRSSPTRRPADP